MAESSSSKKIRLEKNVSSNSSNQKRQNTNIIEKVLCRNDYLVTIIKFFAIGDICKSIPLLSRFHYDVLNSIQQKKLIENSIKYQFNMDYLHLLNVKLLYKNCNNNKDSSDNTNITSISQQICDLFSNWDMFSEYVLASPNIKVTRSKRTDESKYAIYDLHLLTHIENADIFIHWLLQVL